MIYRSLDRKFGILWILSFLASALIPFLGSPFLRVLRNCYGPRAFWISGILMVAPLLGFMETSLLGCMIFAHWVLMGVFAEFEERGKGTFWYGILAIALAVVTMWQGPRVATWLHQSPIENSIQKGLELLVQNLEQNPEQKKMMTDLGVTPEALESQLPAILGILFLMGMATGLIFDRRLAQAMGLRFERIVGTPRLIDFKVPDVCVWLFLTSVLLAFVDLGPEALQAQISSVALNLVHFLVGVYFFQGLAVTETALLIFRVGPIMKSLFYILIVGQLFFLLSLVGLADYWFNFRQWLRKKWTPRE